MRGTGPRATGTEARFFFGALRGTGPRATGAGVRFFRRAGTCPPQSLPHPVNPANPGHPASDVIDIKVLTDLFSLLSRRFYRHSGPLGPGAECWVAAVARGPVPRARSAVLKQDEQDEQDGGRLGIRDKGLEDLNVYRIQQETRS